MRYAAALVSLVLLLPACASEPEPAEPAALEPAAATAASDAGSDPDTTGAAVWALLQDEAYQANWQLWPDTDPFYTGQEPHGMLLTTYLNDTAYEALVGDATEMPDGAMIVKENYTPDSTLAAITVMLKVEGYNPEHSDWFFTKHLPSGALDTTPEGRPMEGRLTGCQSCHAAQRANDYLFTSALDAE